MNIVNNNAPPMALYLAQQAHQSNQGSDGSEVSQPQIVNTPVRANLDLASVDFSMVAAQVNASAEQSLQAINASITQKLEEQHPPASS